MDTDTTGTCRPSAGRLILCFVFAWAVSIVCALSTTVTAVCFFDMNPDNGFSFRVAIIGLALAVLRYAAGAVVLGTLTRQRIRTWTAAFVFVIPAILLQALTFASASVSDVMRDDLLGNPGAMIVMPIVYVLISPFVSFYFIRIGEELGDQFTRPKAVLNIPWQHWLWVLPFFLFQVIGVPLFLLLALWKIEVASRSWWKLGGIKIGVSLS